MPYKPKNEYVGTFPEDVVKCWDCMKRLAPVVDEYGFAQVFRALAVQANHRANTASDYGNFNAQFHHMSLDNALDKLANKDTQYQVQYLQSAILKCSHADWRTGLEQELVELGAVKRSLKCPIESGG